MPRSVRLIKEEDPPRPSTRLRARATLPTIAAPRKTEPAKLSRLVRGELDWIVMKCLEKDRTRRYETAGGLAGTSSATSTTRRSRLARHRPAIGCGSSRASTGRRWRPRRRLAVLLMLGAIVSTWQAVRARQAEARAIQKRPESGRPSSKRAPSAIGRAGTSRGRRGTGRWRSEKKPRPPGNRCGGRSTSRTCNWPRSLGVRRYLPDAHLLEAYAREPGMPTFAASSGTTCKGWPDRPGGRLAHGRSSGRLSPDGLHYVYVAEAPYREKGPAAGRRSS